MKFSVATFNLENLITADKPIYNGSEPRYTQAQYIGKTNWVRQQLLKMDADIIGFQEVFEEEALRDCLKGTRMEDWHLALAEPCGALPVNGILSRFPIVHSEIIRNIPFSFEFFDDKAMSPETTHIHIPIEKFSRGVLRADIALTPEKTLTVMVAHLKSKRPTMPEGSDRDTASYAELAQGSVRGLIRRAIEACGVRALLSDAINANPAQPIVLMGDLNDADSAVTNQVILGEPPFRALDEEQKIAKWQHVFVNTKDVQARKSIESFHYTYVHNGRYESIDNVFVSNHFADRNPQKCGRVIDVRAYNDHVIDSTVSMDRKPREVTDHGQVVVNMELLEANKRY
jgi:endonuclease/exonuclease/phosphatase family metal-dependent hydrolase